MARALFDWPGTNLKCRRTLLRNSFKIRERHQFVIPCIIFPFRFFDDLTDSLPFLMRTSTGATWNLGHHYHHILRSHISPPPLDTHSFNLASSLILHLLSILSFFSLSLSLFLWTVGRQLLFKNLSDY